LGLVRKLNVRRTLFVTCALIISAFLFGAAAESQDRPRTQTPAPSPSPTPQTSRPGRGAPTLGEPPPVPKLKPTPTPTPPEEIDEGDKIRINADLVQLQVRVIDRNNRPIGNLPQNEFHVFEDGVAQPIEYFTREDVPISYGLAVDTSGSLRSQLPTVIEAGKSIINSNKTGDETFLVRFVGRENSEIVQNFTANKENLMDALDNMYVEGGQSAVVDAIYLSAEYVAEYRKGDESDRRRRALIVITDGEDRNSFYNQEQLFARLREEDVQIFVIGFVNELDKEAGFIRKSPREKAVNLINKLASETGGRAFFPESLSELPQIANEIIRDLRTQYVLAYNPTNKSDDGTYRAIKVTVDQPNSSEKRIALTRTGRMARRESATSPKAPPVRLPTTGTNGPTRKP
jgi:Ca-activated chloride channel homolog